MAVINLKEEKRISVNGEWDKVTTHPDNQPIFRQNGHELVFDSSNVDYVNLINQTTTTTLDQVSFKVTTSNMGSNPSSWSLVSVGKIGVGFGLLEVWFLNTGLIVIDVYDNTAVKVVNLNGGVQSNLNDFIEWSFDGVKLYRDGVVLVDLTSFGTIGFGLQNGDAFAINRRSFQNSRIGNMTLNVFEYLNETFNPIDIDSSGDIEGSNGTVATVNTSHASGLSYILGTVFQKSSFALSGNGTTEKIVGHLGTDLILTSTPLEGGFTLDGVVYNLTEGLGNEIKSTTGETATIQGFTGTGLNFGGWQKGNSIDGWTPYTIV